VPPPRTASSSVPPGVHCCAEQHRTSYPPWMSCARFTSTRTVPLAELARGSPTCRVLIKPFELKSGFALSRPVERFVIEIPPGNSWLPYSRNLQRSHLPVPCGTGQGELGTEYITLLPKISDHARATAKGDLAVRRTVARCL
jgi:hypothetical protein